MKFSVLLFLLSSFTSYTQTLKVVYTEKRDLTEKLKSIKDPMVRQMVIDKMGTGVQYELISQKGISVYQGIVSSGREDLHNNVTVIGAGGEDIIYRNFIENVCLKQTEFMSRTFLVNSEIQKWTWDLTPDTMKIGDYLCKKARIQTDANTIVAWFTSEIPSNNGPRDYFGLPGLILKVETGTLVIEAIDISFSTEDTIISKPTKGKEISKEAFEKMQKEKIKALTKDKAGGEGVQVIK